MLFDIGWPELMLIGVIALIVIGPKDLPRAMRIAGYWIRKARSMSREFQSSIDQMIREAELDEMREEVKKATEFDLEGEFQRTVDPTGELAETIKPSAIPDYFTAPSDPTRPIGVDPEQPELPFGETAPEPAAPPPSLPEGEPPPGARNTADAAAPHAAEVPRN